MGKIDIFEYLPKIMSELQKGILVNTKSEDKINSMTIAWGQFGIEWKKMFFTIYIRHGRYTHELIEKTNEFTVSVPIERTPEVSKTIAYIGSRTGKNINKFEDCNLTVIKGEKVNSPAVKELPLTIECKVLYKQEQDISHIPTEIIKQFYPKEINSDVPMSNRDFHTVYYGEIVNAYIITNC